MQFIGAGALQIVPSPLYARTSHYTTLQRPSEGLVIAAQQILPSHYATRPRCPHLRLLRLHHTPSHSTHTALTLLPPHAHQHRDTHIVQFTLTRRNAPSHQLWDSLISHSHDWFSHNLVLHLHICHLHAPHQHGQLMLSMHHALLASHEGPHHLSRTSHMPPLHLLRNGNTTSQNLSSPRPQANCMPQQMSPSSYTPAVPNS